MLPGIIDIQSATLDEEEDATLRRQLIVPNDRRMWALFRALDKAWPLEQLHELTRIDPWFLEQFAELFSLLLVEMRESVLDDEEVLRLELSELLLMDNRLPMVVFGMEGEGDVTRALVGERIGTLVTSQ